jgi:adenine phosphoribosyltransferase
MFHVEQYRNITTRIKQKKETMDKELLLKNLRNIPDFPIPGIQFKDVTSLFKNPACLREMDNALYEMYKDKGITKIVGIESRGFVMASSLAVKLGAGFVPIRKPGKLPAETISETYGKEYGRDTIEIHKDAICEDDVVLIHDDLLATGGTMLAAYHLVQKLNPKKVMINFIIELEGLKGRETFPADADIECLLTLEGK